MVEIIPKEVLKPSKGLDTSFYLIVLLLIFSIGSYFVLNNLLKRTEGELLSLKADLEAMATPERISLERDLLVLESRVKEFSSLVEKHLQSSKSFWIIEKNTHPQVWFSGFNLNSDKGELKVSGQTRSFETLGQQIFLLGREAVVSRVNLDRFSITKEGRITFDLSLSFRTGFLTR